MAGQSTSPGLGLAQLLLHRDRRRRGRESVLAVARARDLDGHRGAHDARRLRPACRPSRLPRPSPSRRPPIRAAAWPPVSITTTSTGMARRSTSRRFRRAARTRGVTSQGSPRPRRPARTPTSTRWSPWMRPAIRPRSRRAHTIVLDPGAVSAPTSVTAAATPTNQAPQVSWGAPTGALFIVHHYNVYRDGAGTPVGVVIGATTFTDTTPNLVDGSYTYQVVAADRRRHDRRRLRRRSPSSCDTHRPRGAGRCRCQRRARRLHRHHLGRVQRRRRLGRSPLRRAPLAVVDAAGVRLPMATRPARSRRLRAPTRRRSTASSTPIRSSQSTARATPHWPAPRRR